MAEKDYDGIAYVSVDNHHVLSCPNCGFEHGLHQYKYRISNPESCDNRSVVINASDLSHHDSKGWHLDDTRPRESIEIKFWCEACGKDNMTLQILQHKGTTYLHWGKSV